MLGKHYVQQVSRFDWQLFEMPLRWLISLRHFPVIESEKSAKEQYSTYLSCSWLLLPNLSIRIFKPNRGRFIFSLQHHKGLWEAFTSSVIPLAVFFNLEDHPLLLKSFWRSPHCDNTESRHLSVIVFLSRLLWNILLDHWDDD